MAFAPNDISNNAVANEYQAILNDLNKAVHENQPDDVLQFCSNFFSRRLEQERLQTRQMATTKEIPQEQPEGMSMKFIHIIRTGLQYFEVVCKKYVTYPCNWSCDISGNKSCQPIDAYPPTISVRLSPSIIISSTFG